MDNLRADLVCAGRAVQEARQEMQEVQTEAEGLKRIIAEKEAALAALEAASAESRGAAAALPAGAGTKPAALAEQEAVLTAQYGKAVAQLGNVTCAACGPPLPIGPSGAAAPPLRRPWAASQPLALLLCPAPACARPLDCGCACTWPGIPAAAPSSRLPHSPNPPGPTPPAAPR